MKHLWRVAVGAAAVVSVLVVVGVARSTPQSYVRVSMTTVQYGPAPLEQADVYLVSAPKAVVVAIHGGAWQRGDKSDVQPICEAANGAGYACLAINYALAPAYTWPTQLTELGDAFHWAQTNSGVPVIWWGVSAGAHLALVAGHVFGNPAISWSAPTDLGTMVESRNAGVTLLGCKPVKCPDKSKSASPALLATPGDSPVLIVHTESDRTVDYQQALEENTALNAAGVPHVFLSYPGAAHGINLAKLAMQPSLQWAGQVLSGQ